MRRLPVEPLAGLPDCVLGVAIIRGAPVPVVDLGRLLGDRDTAPARFVTVRLDGRVVALAVDDVAGVATLAPAPASLPPLLQGAADAAVAAIAARDAGLLLFLDAARLVPPGLADRIAAPAAGA